MDYLCNMTKMQQKTCIGLWSYVFEDQGLLEPEPPTDEGIIVGYHESNSKDLVDILHPGSDLKRVMI